MRARITRNQHTGILHTGILHTKQKGRLV